jgi:GNAT superfamily N-acetyltransferase
VDLDLRRPTIADHLPVVSVVDEWWGGFHVAPLVQNLFFEHFSSTSFVEDGDDGIRSFLLGFDSADEPHTFYILFVGVRPDLRGTGRGAALYERSFADARSRGRSVARCITGLANTGSIGFHRAMGFDLLPGDGVADDGTSFHRDHGGPGIDQVLFRRPL